MSYFSKNADDSYQYGYDDISSSLGREKCTIYHRGVAKKSDSKRKRRTERRSMTETALEYARYMGMGVYMTSTSFPSPFYPANDSALYDETFGGGPQNVYTMSKIW